MALFGLVSSRSKNIKNGLVFEQIYLVQKVKSLRQTWSISVKTNLVASLARLDF